MEKNQKSLTPYEDATTSRELARLIGILKRASFHWRAAGMLVLAGLAAAALFLALRKPRYQSETVILYREGIRASYLGSDAGESLRTLGAKLREMLFARPQLQKIIEEFSLYPEIKRASGEVAAVDEFRLQITFRARSTDVFAIAFTGRTPDESQAVTARLAESLVEENTRLRIEQTKIQTEFLASEKKRGEEELKSKEKELAKFLAAHPEFALDLQAGVGGQQGASIRAAAAQRAGGDSALQVLERQAARSRTLLSAPAGSPMPAMPGAPPPDPALAATKAQAEAALTAAKRELADKQARFTEQHPDVAAAKRRVSEATDAVKRADEALSGPPPPSAAGKGEEPSEPAAPGADRSRIQGQLSSIEAEIALRKKKKTPDAQDASETVNRVVALETEWARVSRDVAEARERMAELEAKAFKAQIEASSELGGYSGQMLIIDPAYKPTQPMPPGKTIVVLGALGASVFAAFLLALVRALLDDHLYEVTDVPRFVEVLAAVPKMEPRRWWRRG